MLSIRFLDTKVQIPINSHFFVAFLKEFFDNDIRIVQNRNEKVDIEFVSNSLDVSKFKKLMYRGWAHLNERAMNDYYKLFRLGFREEYVTKSNYRIWFTCENLRAPANKFDLTFSFDKTDEEFKNIFFPYWFYRCNWFGESKKYEIEEKIENLMAPRKPLIREKTVVTFSSEYEILRLQIIAAVTKVAPVDRYGRFYGKFVTSKLATSTSYGMQICNENDLFPNYITEKLQESWVARNVPIWAGLDDFGFFNKEAMIDVTSLSSQEITDRVRSITIDEIMYRQAQPLLLREPKLDEARNALKKMIGNI